jgi:twitching motility protein PilU
MRADPAKCCPRSTSLSLPPVLKDVAMTKRGLAILVGATGSGKSTSLAAMVDYRNENALRPHHHDRGPGGVRAPAQELHRHAARGRPGHRQLGRRAEEHAAPGARRHPDGRDPRPRDDGATRIAFAETGHLCLATLHANSANQALDRIINFFPDERRDQLLMDLSLNLRGRGLAAPAARANGRGPRRRGGGHAQHAAGRAT